jgi:hypothetical protein
MFGQKKIKELNREIKSLKDDVGFWKATVSTEGYRSSLQEIECKELEKEIEQLRNENKRLKDENMNLRGAYNLECLMNDKLKKR